MLCADDITHRSGEQSGVAAGADHEDHGGLGMVGFGNVEIRTGSRLQTVTVGVTDNPDDSGPVLDYAGKDAAADGALTGPLTFCKSAIHDGDMTLAVVGTVEVAAFEQRLADGRKVARGHVIEVRVEGYVFLTLVGVRIGAEAVAIDGAAERRMSGSGNGCDARKVAQAPDELLKEEVGLCRVVAGCDAGAVDIDAGHEEMVGLEAERLM